tara:strand:+ start:235 stop:651 length:417 start_codon:yes stop_codon:yes gene_type:complete
MAGFPTESEKDFADTVDVIDRAQVIYPHVFSFSARPGTPAARIPKQVPKEERRRRAAALRTIGEANRRLALRQMIGRTGQMIVERVDVPARTNAYHGRLANYMPVRLVDPENVSQNEVGVEIQGVSEEVLVARVSSSE